MKKIVINFCPTGMIPDKEMTPHAPISIQEIVEQTHEAYELGITIVHLHARDAAGKPSWKAEIYQEIIEGIRQHCSDLVICASTSGRHFSDFEKRSEVIELKPDMCSLTLSSLNFPNQASVNSPDTIQRLAEKMKEYGVRPELECFSLGMINYGNYLIDKGLIPEPRYWNLIFGNIAGLQGTLSHMSTAIRDISEADIVALGGIGSYQLKVNATAIAMGYGVRVGIEDNIWWDEKRTRLATNKDLLKRVHKLIKIHGYEWMSPKEFGEKGFYNR